MEDKVELQKFREWKTLKTEEIQIRKKINDLEKELDISSNDLFYMGNQTCQ